MKKVKGKALSLVLSLALVISSFSAIPVSAATKTEYLGASDSATTVKLVTGKSGATSETDVTEDIPYTVTGTTKDHLTVAGLTAADIARKDGSDLVSWTVDSTNSKIKLQLKDSSATGSETIAVRYTVTNHRYTDPTQDILFSKVVYYGIKVYALNSYQITLSATSIDKNGTITPAVGSTPASSTKTVTGNVQKAIVDTSKNGSYATFEDQSVDVPQSDGTFKLNDSTAATPITDGAAAGEFCIKASSSNKVDLALTTIGDKTDGFTATLTAPTGADFLNRGTLVFYATPTVGTGKVTLDTAHTINASATVTNTVTLSSTQDAIKTWHGSTWAVKNSDVFDEKSTGVANPLNTNARIPAEDATNVTGADVVIAADTTMDGNSTVGAVSGSFKFTMNNGYVKSADVTTFVMSKGTVGAVDATTVTVTGGTTGAISATTVSLDAADAKTVTKVGNVSAKTVTVSSSNAAVTTGAVTATGDASSVDAGAATGGIITLSGDKVVVPSINFDYYTTDLELKGYAGSISAPLNAANGTITVSTDANGNVSNATLTGAANINNVQVTEGTLTIGTSLNAGMIGGSGTLVIPAGKLYVKESITGVSLKLSDDKIVPGMTVLSADAYKVYDGMFNPVGYTLDYDAVTVVSNRVTDVFKVKTVNFAGLTIAPEAGTNEIVLGDSATFNVSPYPSGTDLPENTKIKIEFSGSSDNFSYTTTDTSITIKAATYDDLFSSLNKGTITATVVDKDSEIPVYTINPATYDVTMIKTPKATYRSDTGSTLSIGGGFTYQFAVTSLNDVEPYFVVAGSSFQATKVGNSGNTYYYKVKAVGKVGDAAGVYINHEAKPSTVITITNPCDTAAVTVKAGNSYQFRVTGPSQPVFQVAGIGNIPLTSKDGNNYFFKVKVPTNLAKGGHGVYSNGVRVAILTVA